MCRTSGTWTRTLTTRRNGRTTSTISCSIFLNRSRSSSREHPVGQWMPVGIAPVVPVEHTRGFAMNGPSYFEIQANDLKRAIEFYKAVFGWTFTRVDGLPIEYWRIETDG